MSTTAPAPSTPAPAPARTSPAARRGSTLTGTWLLLRFMARRDRVRLSVWALSVVALWLYVVTAFSAVYSTAADRQARAALMSTPTSIMVTGPGYGLDDYTLGAMTANEMTLWVIVALAVMSIMQVVRHTRAEEESSRSELIRAAVVGRHAPAVAAMLLVLAANVVIAALTVAVFAAGGLAVLDSVVLAAGVGLTAMVFAAVAVVTSQVTAHRRGASGMAIGVLGLAAVVRGAGDIQHLHGSALSWFSPIAWAQQTRAFVEVRAWPLLLSVVLTVLLLVVAAFLASHRDFGAGMIADRRGRADARPTLRSPFAVAWRQQRTAIMWWALGTGLMWLASGTYLRDIGTMIEDMAEGNPAVAAIFGGADGAQTIVNSFVYIMLLFTALIAVGYGISSLLRARTEETQGRTEWVLATPVSRRRWLGAQVAVAGIGAIVLVAVGTLGMAIGAYSVGVTDPGLATYAVAAAVYLPAVGLVLALATAIYAWAPRLTSLPWAFLVIAFVVGLFGEAFQLPDWIKGISPLWWVPQMPLEAFTWPPVLALTAITAALFTAAFTAFHRRDVPTV
ncbi:MAG: hypothetical protein FWD18_02235 [Micrococcales bacterium]|nr:hypothetical protein [Micrococcales bacterium]